ncbi:hypothetical protein FORC087_146 (plasmid) [Bacillus cereus]|nr:hypothetical protein FORC087_146 [Bacillus cereus]
MVFVIGGAFIVSSIINNDYEPNTHPSIRDDRDPLRCAHYGGEWDTGGLFGEAKCVYNQVDESDNSNLQHSYQFSAFNSTSFTAVLIINFPLLSLFIF